MLVVACGLGTVLDSLLLLWAVLYSYKFSVLDHIALSDFQFVISPQGLTQTMFSCNFLANKVRLTFLYAITAVACAAVSVSCFALQFSHWWR